MDRASEDITATPQSQFLLETEGYCHCCRSQTVFRSNHEWLRDFYSCALCGSLPRNRHLNFVLDSKFPGWEKARIHECAPAADWVGRHARHYTFSIFDPTIEPGTDIDGIRCENIEALTFRDNSIDLFITQDVLEHIFHPDRAIAEIMRVLRPGGAHIFTVPKQKWLTHSRRCAELIDGEVNHILEPQYHGSPEGKPALVTWEYGFDLELLLSEWSGCVPVETHRMVDRPRGIDAEFNEIFVIRKPPAMMWKPSVFRRWF